MKTLIYRPWATALAIALLVLFPTGGRAQFNVPPVSSAACASCGATNGASHKPGCEYYSAPEEEETPTPQPQPKPKPKPTPQTKPQPKSQPKPQQTQSTHLSDYRPLTEEERQYHRALEGRWVQTWTDEDNNTLRVVARNDGWGIFNFTASKWMLEPRYQRIVVPGQESAVVQLMNDGTWRIKELCVRVADEEDGEIPAEELYDENPYEVEFDEIKYVDGQPWVALNKKEANGRNHWRIWKDGRWFDVGNFQQLEVYANKYSGKYDVVAQDQSGEWQLAIEGTGSLSGMSSVERVGENGLYIIGVRKDGKEQFQLVHNDNLAGLLPTAFDRITPENGYFTLGLDGKTGIAHVVKEEGKLAYADILVPPEHSYAKIESAHIPELNANYQYAVMGDAGGYALYSLKHKMQMLPAIFSRDEVQAFNARLMCSANARDEKVRNRYNDTFSTEGRGDFREYCQGVANECYRGLTVNLMTESEAREALKEENLSQEYFQKQNKLYNRESKLGKYDANLKAFFVETHWGNALLPVPPEEAEAVKSAWKLRSKLNVVEYALDLDKKHNPTLSSLTLSVGGKQYRGK